MHVDELSHGRLHQFSDWPEESLRVGKPGVYTIWRGAEFLYVGISWQDRPNSKGLFGRLNSHASGRRSGDQFCIYICDTFIIPTLSPEQLEAVGQRALSLDQMTKSFVRSELSFRAVHTDTGTEAREIEKNIRSVGLRGSGLPLLNPLS
jgi:hypothetical protein